MEHRTGALAGIVTKLTRDWRRLFRLILPFSVAYAGLLLIETIAVSRIDTWLSVDSFESATRYALIVSALALFGRLCIIGFGFVYASKALGNDGHAALRPAFAGVWCVVCFALASALLLVELWSHTLHFGNQAWSETAIRWFFLAMLYLRMAFYYVAIRILAGAICAGSGGLIAAWSALTTRQSIGLFVTLLLLKLFVDDLLVSLLSFLPFVSPFWFVPDELSPMRHMVGQGIQIVAQSCGVFLYVAFWIVAVRHLGMPSREAGSPTDPRHGY